MSMSLALSSIRVDPLFNQLANVLGGADLHIPLTHSAIARVGAVTPAFTRASVKNIQNNDGYLVSLLSGELGFPGARRVYNLLTFTEAFDNAAWTKINGGTGSAPTVTSGQTDPNGGSTAWRLQADSGATPAGSYSLLRQNVAAMGFTGRMDSIWMKSNTGATQYIYWSSSSNGRQETITTTWTRFSIISAGTSANFDIGSYPDGTTTNINGTDTQAVDILIWHPQTEDVRSQTTQTAGEYVSVGVESAPAYHGAMVDGVKYFNTDISGVPLTGMTGPEFELAGTQILATADIRDMTTGSWTLGATMTRARTSVGADGVANSATRLTGGAVAATNTCYTTITAAASSRTYSALVKRITGTGPVRIVQTGTETDISSQLTTTGWTLVKLTASVLNVAVGFKIDTNGDAIDVDFNQFEAGSVATSRMVTTGAARAKEQLTYTSGPVSSLLSLACTFISKAPALASPGAWMCVSARDSGSTDFHDLQLIYTGGVVKGSLGTSPNPGTPLGSTVTGASEKMASSISTTFRRFAQNGVAATAAGAAALPVVTNLDIGMEEGSWQGAGNIKDVYGWTKSLSQSELNLVSA